MASAAIQAHLQPSYRLPMVLGFQERELDAAFERNRNPNFSDLLILAAEVGLPLDAVRVWFENRLARWRVSQGLPANGRMVNHA
uniref:Homeodomain-only protein n=1 Tax=Amblyomma tuberculatum TaxID=48802 RepID=A0A6M2E295_9ACAR